MLTGLILIVLGIFLVAWGLRSPVVQNESGFRAKFRILLSNGFSGPDDSGRPFFAGLMCILLGALNLALRHSVW